MNRRGFLASILALGVAPAIVRADSLMRIIPLETEIIVPSAQLFTVNSLGGFYQSFDLSRELRRAVRGRQVIHKWDTDGLA